MSIKEKLNTAKQDGTISKAFDDSVAATLSISSSGATQAERAERESLIQQSIVQLEGGYKKFNLTDHEADKKAQDGLWKSILDKINR